MKNKTASEWLEIARANGEPWVDQAVENIAAQREGAAAELRYPYLSLVIMRQFSWSETDKDTQGHKYWQDIYNSIVKAENKK